MCGNGLRSLHQHIGPEYQRIRLGIGHPGDKSRVANYVLGDFAKSDQDWLEPLLTGLAQGAGELAQGETAAFINKIALTLQSQNTPTGKKKAAHAPAPNKPVDPDGIDSNSETSDKRSPLQKLLTTLIDPSQRFC